MKRSSLILAVAIFSVFFAVLVHSQAYGEDYGFEVSPSPYDFGDVALGTSSTVTFTATNAVTEADCRKCHGTSLSGRHHDLGYTCSYCHGKSITKPIRDCIVCHPNLTILNIQLKEDSSPYFSINAPNTPFDIYTRESARIDVTFSPTAEGYASAVLKIYAHSPYLGARAIQLGGFGVQEPTLEGPVDAILTFINQSVDLGTLVGAGNGKSASKHMNSLINMIEASGDLIANGYIEEACQQLQNAYMHSDGEKRPNDFVAGVNVPTVAEMILNMMESMECE